MNIDINWNVIIPIMSSGIILLTAMFWFFGSIIADHMKLPDKDHKKIMRIGFEFSMKHLILPLALGILISKEYSVEISISSSIFLILFVVIPCMRLILWRNSRWWSLFLVAISVLFWFLFTNSVELVWNLLSTGENFVLGVVQVVVLVLMMLYVLKELAKIYGIKCRVIDIFVDVVLDNGNIISDAILLYFGDFVVVFFKGQRMMINKDKIVIIRERKINLSSTSNTADIKSHLTKPHSDNFIQAKDLGEE